MTVMLPSELALIDERRQALGVALISLEHEEVAGGELCFGGVGSWQNLGMGLGLAGPVSEAELDRVVSFYVERGVEPKVELCPFADPTLVRGLADRGFVPREFENVLYRALSPLSPRFPEGATVREVDRGDAAEVELFIDVSTSGFRPVDEPITDALHGATLRTVMSEPNVALIVELDSLAVAGAAMEVAPPLASLFGTSVRPAYRRRGIQRALIEHRCEIGRLRGCTVASIHSRPHVSTERNAIGAGFVMAYSKVVLVKPVDGLPSSP